MFHRHASWSVTSNTPDRIFGQLGFEHFDTQPATENSYADPVRGLYTSILQAVTLEVLLL